MVAIIVDDRDPSIVYSSGWSSGGLSTEYNYTTTYTNKGGATATLNFEGVSIGVYGTIPNTTSTQTAPNSSYQLDANNPLWFQPNTITTQHGYLFYQSSQLTQGQHQLVVTNMINGSTYLVLDFFVILTQSSTTVSSPAVVITSTDSRGSTNTSSVIGGSIGGVVACILLVVGIIYFWRRTRRDKPLNDQNSTAVQSVWINPSPPSTLPGTTPLLAPLPPSKTMPGISLPSTSHHISSSSASNQPAPPAYSVEGAASADRE